MLEADDLLAAGMQLHQQGRLADAEKVYRHVLSIQAAHPHALHLLGILAQQVGRHEMAVEFFRRAIGSDACVGEFHYNLGNSLLHLGRNADAASAFADAARISPGLFEAHHNLANALMLDGRPGEAIAAYESALRIRPDDAPAHNNFGMALRDHARLDEAIEHFRRAIQLDPTYAHAHSNLVYALHFHAAYDAPAIADEQRKWADQHAEPVAREAAAAARKHDNDRSPDRRIRIGYVSPNFREHPVGRAMLPLLEAHDSNAFEVFCYADTSAGDDDVARRLKQRAAAWHVTSGMSDEQLAELIREHRIDILIDLTLHMNRNRLLVFARKPAPVQVSFIGYPAGTGVRQIEYRITDAHLDPDDGLGPERLVRLPHCFWCYVGEEQPAVNELPARANGHVTFGSLNNPVKMNAGVVQLWSRVLRALPTSQLMLFSGEKSPTVDHPLLRLFANEGIDRDRITFVPRLPRDAYLRQHHAIDIGLDTFPYNGHMTSCDALWMGVPLVSLRGETSVGRGGVSLLSNLGLTELLAATPDEFVQIATSLASDLSRLSALRQSLRPRMRRSPLCDAGLFTRSVESAYRNMWRAWASTVA